MILLNLLFAASSGCASNTATDDSGLITATSLPHTCADKGTLNEVFLIIFSILGGMAFLFFVIAGMRYALSKGEPDNIQKAKNEMKYSLMGLIIAALAAAIVNFVLNRLGSK